MTARVPPARRLVAAGTFAALLGACRGPAVVAAPVEVPVLAVAADAGGIAVRPRTAADSAACHADLHASSIRSRGGCYFDERITHGPGLLTYPCDGDGPATAVFEDHRYEGVVAEGVLTLALSTELDWEDGCRWATKHLIRGAIASKRFTWSYSDAAVKGQACSGACTGAAEISIDAGEPPVEPDEPDDDGDP